MAGQTSGDADAEGRRGRLSTILCIRSCDGDILGPEKLILAFSEQLAGRGIRAVIANLWDGQPPTVALHDEASRRGIESHVLAMRHGTDLGVIRMIRELVERTRPDVLFTHDQRSEISALLAMRGRLPLVGAYYGQLATRSVKLRLQELTSFISFRFYRRVFANSEAQRRELLRWRLPPERVEVLPSFIDTAALRPPSADERVAARRALDIEDDARVLVTIARLSAQKGHVHLLNALPGIRERFERVLYLIVGEGDFSRLGEGGRDELEAQVVELRLEENVRFLGYRSDISTVLHAADLLVAPSISEGMSVTLLDAMAAGLPIVATAVGGTPEVVVDGETGLLVPPADPAALERAVVALLEDRELSSRFGAAAQRRAASHFDAGPVSERIIRACERAAFRA